MAQGLNLKNQTKA